MAGLFPYLDLHEAQGADGALAGRYGKFSGLDTTSGSLSPGRPSVARKLNQTGNTGLSQAVPGNAKVEAHGHQGGVNEATGQGARKA